MTAVWAVLALAALAGAVAVGRRRDLPRRRALLTLLWTLAVLSGALALQGVLMVTAAVVMLAWGLVLVGRGGLRERGGRFTGRGVAVLLLLVSGGLLLAFAVGAAVDTGSPGRYAPTSEPPRGQESP